MPDNEPNEPVPGWIGGFAQSNPDFAYPDPNLTSLDMLGNLDNIDKLQRQQGVKWPEFSWQTDPGKEQTRCFQMFSPFISRLGYTDEGRVYSIICPQQGACSETFGCMNVEVTVTGQRGWADESSKEIAADMTVQGTIWFSPGAKDFKAIKRAKRVFDFLNLPFPLSKANGIIVTTHKQDNPSEPIFPVSTGESTLFESPDFARHQDEAWSVGTLGVEIGPVKKTGHKVVDEFNEIVMKVFNIASGNMLKDGNLLTWNVWFEAPTLVDQEEWAEHAEKWRKSIDADHGSPTGPGTDPRYFDGKPFKPSDLFFGLESVAGSKSAQEVLIDEEEFELENFLAKHESKIDS